MPWLREWALDRPGLSGEGPVPRRSPGMRQLLREPRTAWGESGERQHGRAWKQAHRVTNALHNEIDTDQSVDLVTTQDVLLQGAVITMSAGHLRYPVIVLDLDGTLVDSVYQHVVAWQTAFHDVGLRVSAHSVHEAIGMGGDLLVSHVAGDAAELAVVTRSASSTTSTSGPSCGA